MQGFQRGSEAINFLTARELVSVIWLIVLAVWAGRKLPKESISGVFRAALNIKVLTPFLLLGLYELIIVYLLYRTGFWAADLVKETIF